MIFKDFKWQSTNSPVRPTRGEMSRGHLSTNQNGVFRSRDRLLINFSTVTATRCHFVYLFVDILWKAMCSPFDGYTTGWGPGTETWWICRLNIGIKHIETGFPLSVLFTYLKILTL